MESVKKVAVITGGAKGIGASIVMEFAKIGYDVVFTYNSTMPDNVIAIAREAGAEVMAVKCDVSNEAEVVALFKAVEDKFNRLDVLVNNAGITNDKLLLRMTTEDFTRVINTNLTSCFLTTKNAIKVMGRAGGAIVNVSSVVGLMGNAGQSNYCASKAGMLGFTKAIAKEYGSRGIRVNAVAPGFIESDMTLKLGADLIKKYQEQIPMKRFGTSADVANLCVFLASEKASYITGQVITIDGGMYM
ncbi:MAG TPA: 3-oxoacyl-[acyl-carrier-protein] reductase [Candidatus Wallbacteria bacterium]|nr:3-oxoacyl-[acyl-carrier-protein] reductase [Candidatus Wallbacteria bacterium]